jgi:Uncharacterized conserved protein
MNESELLDVITKLSVEFGACRYVRGGGGNTSCKNDVTMWIKPSGISLLDMTGDKFVGVSREKMTGLYGQTFPEEDQARESAVKDYITTTILPQFDGRPSVEAPLHNTFPQRFVVHTHPAVVNGMTCSQKGEEVCRQILPDALWVNFVEPGYKLSKVIRDEIVKHQKEKGKAPEILFLANHGVFIAHDDADGIRRLYDEVMTKIEKIIKDAGLFSDPERKAEPAKDRADMAKKTAAETMADNAKASAASGWFSVPEGALTPDHIVYSKSYMMKGEVTPEGLTAYQKKFGYWPRVVETKDAVYGFGSSQKVADLALEMAWDAAQIVKYAGAFGGVKYLEPRFVKFIEGWEVESYRQRFMQ